MSWAKYTPMDTSRILEIDDAINLIAGDGITSPDGENYQIVSISADETNCTAYHYEASQFETLTIETLNEWRNNEYAPVELVCLHQSYTVIDEETDTPVGLRFYGSFAQSPEIMKELGKNHFGFALQLVIEPGMTGEDISEPYTADYFIFNGDFLHFIDGVCDELAPELCSETAFDTEEDAKILLDQVLAVFERNADTRLDTGHEEQFNEFFVDDGTEYAPDADTVAFENEDEELTFLQHI